MQGLQPGVVLAVALAFVAGDSAAQDRGPLPLPESRPQETPLVPSAWTVSLPSAVPVLREVLRIEAPGARYVKVHFSRFEIPDGVIVEVSDPRGSEAYRYDNAQREQRTIDWEGGDDGIQRFSALSVGGDTAVVRLLGRLDRFDTARHGVVVDGWAEGRSTPQNRTKDGGAWQTETTCGANERFDAVCWADDYPAEYDRGEPVAKLVTARGAECTAWRVGPDNHLLTAEHCISSQADLDGSEVWFNYQVTACGGGTETTPVKVAGKQLLASDSTLDYALFTVDNFSSITQFGNLGLDVRNGGLGEGIFIPQHGLGNPLQISIESDMNASGLCEIDDPDYYGSAAGTDIGYYCDTTSSSSGSPVLSSVSGKVIALHHLGGCFNSGTKMSLIWSDIAAFFNGKVPAGDRSRWEAGNVPPSARFSADCQDLACSFDASGSNDGDGSIVDYKWSFSDGGSATGMNVDYEFSGAGSFDVTLSIQDDGGAADSTVKTVSVALPNTAPTASFSIQCTDNDCSFDGSGSSDPDGSITAWDWDFGDGVTASGSTASHQYGTAGGYTITLTVQDDDGAGDSRSQTITLSMPNATPTASFSYQCTGNDCSFDGSGSGDPDGNIAAWDWDFGDGARASGSIVTHSFGTAGSYKITLTVQDDAGAGDSRSQTISLSQPNAAPAASFSVNCDALDCTVDATASSDPDGSIADYRWNFGDGTTATGRQVSHGYAADGSYRIQLTVEDNAGASAGTSSTVKVTAPDDPSPTRPVARFSANCDARSCTLDAGSSTESEAGIARYDWDFGDGTTGEGRTITHEYSADGSYRVTLEITDSAQLSDSRTRTIDVESQQEIVLSVSASGSSARTVAVLSWSGVATAAVMVLRDGKVIAEADNSGQYVDMKLRGTGKPSYYQVCDANRESCSAKVALRFAAVVPGGNRVEGSLPGKKRS